MAINNNITSVIVEEQIPDFIRDDHDNFVQFLKSYYEFLESTSPPTRLPLIVANPIPLLYNATNPYGGTFQVGETIVQKANLNDTSEITATAKVFSWSGNTTVQDAVITSFGGTNKTFVKNFEIVGERSGVKFFPKEEVESLKSNPKRASLDLLATKDIDDTLDDYVQYIKNEFAINLPSTLAPGAEMRTVLKNVRDFYKSRGTENSFKFLFRLLYGEDASIYFPEEDMLRASDANWDSRTFLRAEIPRVDLKTLLPVSSSQLAGRKIKGRTSEASAIVESVQEIVYQGFRFAELVISSKLGTFAGGEVIQTDNVGDGTVIETTLLGLANKINIVDPGSNYAVGDQITVSSSVDDTGRASGAVAEVMTVNSVSGAITSADLIDPGYNYNSIPTLDATGPHNADAGATRFEAGPLETIFYNDFSQYTDANSFFAESDNRGPLSNVGVTRSDPEGPPHYYGRKEPASITGNSIGNFITVPGVDEGLKGYWKMNSYYPKDVTISTADGTLGDGNDPVANNGLSFGLGLDAQAAYSTTDINDVYIETVDNMQVVTIYDPSDTDIGAAWRAFNVEDGLDRTFSVTLRPDSAGAVGGTHYIRVYEYDEDLPADKYYVSGLNSAVGPDVQFVTIGVDGRMVNLNPGGESGQMAGLSTTDWITTNFTYTPTGTAKWASVVVLNWTNLGTRKLHVQPIRIQGPSLDVVKGPRIGDITFVADPNHDSMQQNHLNYVNHTYTNAMAVPDRTGANTYLSTGHYGFQPVVFDESGHGHHAYVAVSGGGARTSPTINVYSDVAFANAGIYGAGSNSLGTFGEGGIVLMPHDDIRNANTQSWVFWYKPHIHDMTAATAGYTIQRRIITRDRSSHWSIGSNGGYSSVGSAGDYEDVLFTFQGARFDNNTNVYDDKLANSSGYFPGGSSGAINATDGGVLRLGTWNMIAITLDYNTDRPGNIGKTMPSGSGQAGGVGNVYIFNTVDGLLVANGFTFFPEVDANNAHNFTQAGELGWETDINHGGLTQGRAVLLGENCESANGDNFISENTVQAQGQYDEVRYYDKTLSWMQIESLFYNPGGRFDKTLSGDWCTPVWGNEDYTAWSRSSPPEIDFHKTTYEDAAGGTYMSLGNISDADHMAMTINKNIPFDPTVRYKMSIRAKDASDSTTSNAMFGMMGLSNTGIELIGTQPVNFVMDDPKYHWKMDSANSTGWITNEINPDGNAAVWGTHSTDGNTFSTNTIFTIGKSANTDRHSMIGLLSNNAVAALGDEVTYTFWFDPGGDVDASKRLLSCWPTFDFYQTTGWNQPPSVGDKINARLGVNIGATTPPSPTGYVSITDSIVYGYWNFFAITLDYVNNKSILYSYNTNDGFVNSWTYTNASMTRVSANNTLVMGNFYDGPEFPMTRSSGGFNNANYARGITGRFDQVRAFDRVLTSDEISNLYDEHVGLIPLVPTKMQDTIKFIQSPTAGANDGAGYQSSLGPDWFIYTGVYGGNTAPEVNALTTGWKSNPGRQMGHGGNTAQEGYGVNGEKTFYDWANPAKLHGSLAETTQGTFGNTAFIRPVIWVNQANRPDQTLLDYIRIEQQKDAILTAEIGAEFTYPGKYLDDSGKIGSSLRYDWNPKFIQDDKFYQIYSYVIKSGISLGTYKEAVKKLVHPAGLTMFGQVDIQSLASVQMAAFEEKFLGDIVDLFREYYLGAESSTLFDYANIPIGGVGVGYKTAFGLNNAVATEKFNLDAAHGTTPHGAGRYTPGSPGWIAWDQSPLTSPYANSHYYANSSIQRVDPEVELRVYDGHPIAGAAAFPTSNAYTTVTDDSIIWHIKGFRTILGTAYQNANIGALFAHSQAAGHDEPIWAGEVGGNQKGWTLATGNWPGMLIYPDQTNLATDASAYIGVLLGLIAGRDAASDWYHRGFGITSPLDIDGGAYRYVRMKVRRVGPGGYGADSWLGACQPETKPASGTTQFGPTMGLSPTEWNDGTVLRNADFTVADRSKFYGSANTAQPSTLIIPSSASPDAKSPWHILEWDMHKLGTVYISPYANYNSGTWPKNHVGGDSADVWKDANPSTGISPQEEGGISSGTRIGHIGFHLCYEPDNANEKFEIEWIQVDDGTGWPRGSYALPAGYANTGTGYTNEPGTSSGSGTGGIPYRIRTSESTDLSNQTIGDFSVAVTPAATYPSEISTGAPVLYTHSDKKVWGSNMDDQNYGSNGAIFRASANTANNLDWIVTEIIDSEKLLRYAPGSPALGDYLGSSLSANGKFSGPVILNTDIHDNLYVGYVYEDHNGGYPGVSAYTDSKPLMLFRLTPTANVQSATNTPADPHNLRSVGSESGSWYGARGRSNTYSVEQILWGNTGGIDGVGVMVGGETLYDDPGGQHGDVEMAGTGSFVDFSVDDLGSLYVVGSGSQNIIKILPAANNSYANGMLQVIHNNLGQGNQRRFVTELANTTTLDANNNILGNWRPQNIITGPKDSLFVACDTGSSPSSFVLPEKMANKITRQDDPNNFITDDVSYSQVAWSPDGTKIAYSASVPTSFTYGNLGRAIFVQEVLAGGSPGLWGGVQLTSGGIYEDTPWNDASPTWSPDGTQIAFASDRDDPGGINSIYRCYANGFSMPGTSQVGGTVFPLTQSIYNEVTPTWRPGTAPQNATRVAYAKGSAGEPYNTDLWIIRPTEPDSNGNLPEGTSPTQITTATGSYIDESPQYSPDGTKIVFRARRSGTALNYNIHTCNYDGTSITNLTNDAGKNEADPSWSADGTQIVFVNRETGWQVYMMDVDGTNRTKITTPINTVINLGPVMSPNGNIIIFSSDRSHLGFADRGNDLYTITHDSGRGANSVYCYHIVTQQDSSTGEYSAKGVYPVYANTRSREYHATLGSGTRNKAGLQQTCAGMVLDHEDPPNLYYMTANTMYRIKPKGYSYQIGDAETEQVFPERYFEDVLGVNEQYVGILGRYRHNLSGQLRSWEENYSKLQIDSRGRIYFPGFGPGSGNRVAHLYCYDRGSSPKYRGITNYQANFTNSADNYVSVGTEATLTPQATSLRISRNSTGSSHRFGIADGDMPNFIGADFPYVTIRIKAVNVDNENAVYGWQGLISYTWTGDSGSGNVYAYNQVHGSPASASSLWPSSGDIGTFWSSIPTEPDGFKTVTWDMTNSDRWMDSTIKNLHQIALWRHFGANHTPNHTYDIDSIHIHSDKGLAESLKLDAELGPRPWIKYNQSNTEFSTLQVVANTTMYTANIDWDFSETSGVGLVMAIDSFAVGATGNSAYWSANDFSEGVYFTAHSQAVTISHGTSSKLMAVVYPNSNGSFVLSDGGQLGFTIMTDDPANETKFWNDGTEGVNKFRGTSPTNLAIRPEKV